MLVPVGVLTAGAIANYGASDQLGRIPMPGKRQLHLDEGKVTLYYEEAKQYAEDDFLIPPDDVRVRVRTRRGRSLPLEGTSGSVAADDRGTRKAIHSVQIPESGTYRLSVGPTARDAPRPSITLGTDLWDEMKPWFVRALIALGIAAALATAAYVALRVTRRRPDRHTIET